MSGGAREERPNAVVNEPQRVFRRSKDSVGLCAACARKAAAIDLPVFDDIEAERRRDVGPPWCLASADPEMERTVDGSGRLPPP